MTGRRRGELAAFLRNRRARVSPTDVGIPPGPRRRTAGLRREEVALLSGVGVTWYTWLEQGRPINASAQILDAVARTLRLDATEHAHLYRLAEVPSAPDDPGDAAAPGDEVQEILDRVAPLPACVQDSLFTVVAWNAPYAVLWQRTLASADRNVLRQCLVIPPCCSPFATGREAELRAMVATLRTSTHPGLDDLVTRLGDESAEFARLWAAHDVAPPGSRVKEFRHAGAGDLRMTVTDLQLAATPGLRMVIYVPADDTSRDRLEWIIAHPAGPPADHVHA
jgi:transcriptional regulator with XRE-family HTH domain